MNIFTIGFTKTTAENFFGRLKKAGVKRILDVRLNNVSQLAGFAKRDDLKFFSKELCGADYSHMTDLAPGKQMLDDYKKHKGEWSEYEKQFLDLMQEREIESLDKSMFDDGCLLCSEDKPHFCHRRLVAEYLASHWGDVTIVHL